MANFNDYLIWRGDIPISKKYPFNEVDSMILARFSYLMFDKINMRNKETISSIYKKLVDFKASEFLHPDDKNLITNLGNSIRFKNMIVTDHIKNNDKKIDRQFSAITIHINSKELYISYIGTDSTINGWKEDFNMSFMNNLPCQISGKEYLERISKKYKNKLIRLGGHSKGGNVAIYAAVTVDENIQNRIIKIDNFDGPGFHKEFIQKYGNKQIIKKIETFIPQDSIIGRMLGHKEKVTICHSNAKNIYQHFTHSWEVSCDKIVKLDKNTKMSENINNMLIEWLNNTTEEDRKIFVDSVFELFESTNADTFKEINKSLINNIPKILSKYKKIPPKERKHISSMIKLFITSYRKSTKKKKEVPVKEVNV